jgi:hypothetical protein
VRTAGGSEGDAVQVTVVRKKRVQRPLSERARRLRFLRLRKQAVAKLRVLIAMVKTADRKLNWKAAEVASLIARLDKASPEQYTPTVRVNTETILDELRIVLEDLKGLKP